LCQLGAEAGRAPPAINGIWTAEITSGQHLATSYLISTGRVYGDLYRANYFVGEKLIPF
jgi:hypothetical protein